MLRIVSPTIVRLEGLESKFLKTQLTFRNKSVDFQIQKLKKSGGWMLQKYGEEYYVKHLEELKAQRDVCLLFEDENGYYTYSGLATYLKDLYPNQDIVNENVYPESKIVPWAKDPKKLRDYQKDSLEKLLEIKHGAVSAATGSGKTLTILYLAKQLGLKTVIAAPSVSIASQIYDLFKEHLGKKYVGKYYSGKKEIKLFTVAVNASLIRVEDPSLFKDVKVLICDESHLVAAETLSKVAIELFPTAPYRYFFSGTQIRNDGKDLLLKSIIGPIVKTVTTKDLIDAGVLAKLSFNMVSVPSQVLFKRDDPNEMTRKHLYYNNSVNKVAATVANKMADNGRQVLILVQEIDQFNYLLPYLNFECKFVCGGAEKGRVPEQYENKDVNSVVAEFNDRKFPILIGTSAVSTGTDFTTVDCILYLMGGKSEIKVKQAIGRGTRMAAGKTDCVIFDFDISNIDILHNHAKIRRKIYKDIYPNIKEVDI